MEKNYRKGSVNLHPTEQKRLLKEYDSVYGNIKNVKKRILCSKMLDQTNTIGQSTSDLGGHFDEHAQALANKFEYALRENKSFLQEAVNKNLSLSEAIRQRPTIKDLIDRDVDVTSLVNGGKSLKEALHANSSNGFPSSNPNFAGFETMLGSIQRRVAPNLMALDIAGVIPLAQATQEMFSMRPRYGTQAGAEAWFNEVDSDYSGTGTHVNPLDPTTVTMAQTGVGLSTAAGEDDVIPEMAVSMEKFPVTARTRNLAANYTHEYVQDLRATFGLDGETILTETLADEITAEINRELARSIYASAVVGAQVGYTTPGIIDFDDANDIIGDSIQKKIFHLKYHLNKEANTIAKETRRGKGNIMIVSSNVAAALSSFGMLNLTGEMVEQLAVDDTGSTFCGILDDQYKVHIDPYANTSIDFAVVGYKGNTEFDGGIYYCPYSPLQLHKVIVASSGQPRLIFKTRYAMVANPFHNGLGAPTSLAIVNNSNRFFRKIKITNL